MRRSPQNHLSSVGSWRLFLAASVTFLLLAQFKGEACAQAPAANATVPFFVMIDPSHGGDDPGARFSDKLLEKDITLAIARKLRMELHNRGVACVLLRDSDATLSYDQRALATNAQRAGLYVAIHAGVPGTGVRVYSSMPQAAARNKKTAGPFVSWDAAQAGFIERSRALTKGITQQLVEAKIRSVDGSAPVLPLNNIAAPAVAIEIAPARADGKLDSLTSQRYQQAIGVAVAEAIVSMRRKMEGGR